MNSCILKKFYVSGVAVAAFITKEFVGTKKLIAETCDHKSKESLTVDISDVQHLEVESKNDKQACVVVVGTTGTGKSSTIAKFTGQNVEVSQKASSVTRHCEIWRNLRNPSEPVWIDTVGYDDSMRRGDEESFKEVLKFIDQHDLRDVAAIIWCVMPQERMDARLQKQAKFINQFGEGLIWNNVIIVAKQPGSFNLEQATQGAIEAAKLHSWKNTKILATGFTYMDDNIPENVKESINQLPASIKSQMLLVTDEQVHDELNKLIKEIERPVQIVFRDSKCVNCGAQGDARLLSEFCHMEMMLIHPESAAYFHPMELNYYHPMDTEVYHSGMLRVQGGPNKECETARNVMAGVVPAVMFLDVTSGLLSASAAFTTHYICNYLATPVEERWTCCGGLNGSGGCKVRFSCCRQPSNHSGCCVRYPCCMGSEMAQGCQRRHKCCGLLESAAGCEQVCKKCSKKWGTEANQCFVKPHNLLKID